MGPVTFPVHFEWPTLKLLEHDNPSPLFVQIAELLSAEIRRGRLRAGDRLPGSRSLAAELGVGRNTVVAAYAELVAEGWLETRAAGGTLVSRELPEARVQRFGKRALEVARAQTPGFEFERHALEPKSRAPAGCLELLGGTPDLRLFPTAVLARAYRRALRGAGRKNLEYTTPFGNERLRSVLAEWVARTRALPVNADEILVTHGSQMALDLLARTLIRPGDRVAVEEVGYQPAWAAFRRAGAELVYIGLDQQGMQIQGLERALEGGALRALYLTPHHQYPTTASLSVGRRLRLLELAAAHRFVVVEDDYDHEFHYDGRPLASLAGADRAGVVVYVGTLAKVLAPGLRLGFLAAPRALIETLGAVRFHVDRQGDSVIECAVAEMIEDGEVQRHAKRMRRIYQARRDAFAVSLERHLGRALQFEPPAGGMSLWAQADRSIDTTRWLERASQQGVTFTLGTSYVASKLGARKLGRYGQCLRLGFTQYPESTLETAVKRMARALK